MRLILDTDIGTNVDDLVALLLCLKWEDVGLEGVTTVYGDVELRSRIVLKVMHLHGAGDIPVASGSRQTLTAGKGIYWAGYEGEGILSHEDEALCPCPLDACDLMISKAAESKGEITLVPIGPLTNVARAIRQEPKFPRWIKEVVLMGGCTSPPYEEHNIYSDPEAARIVFRCGMPITMVGLNVTRNIILGRRELERIKATASPTTNLLVDQVERYLKYKGKDRTEIHDPLAVAVAVDKSFVEVERMRIKITDEGKTIPNGDCAIDVCTDVDTARFMDFLLSTLAR